MKPVMEYKVYFSVYRIVSTQIFRRTEWYITFESHLDRIDLAKIIRDAIDKAILESPDICRIKEGKP